MKKMMHPKSPLKEPLEIADGDVEVMASQGWYDIADKEAKKAAETRVSEAAFTPVPEGLKP